MCKSSLDYYGYLAVDCVGRGGGLALLWKKEFQFELICYSQSVIHSHIREDQPSSRDWFFTEVYGHPEVEKRKEIWDLLHYLNNQVDAPWVVSRDFNEILYYSEKRGSQVQAETQLEEFREALIDCDLIDLSFSGSSFIWSNGRGGQELICKRLDRCVANSSSCNLFPNCKVTHSFTRTMFSYSSTPMATSKTSEKRQNHSGLRQCGWVKWAAKELYKIVGNTT